MEKTFKISSQVSISKSSLEHGSDICLMSQNSCESSASILLGSSGVAWQGEESTRNGWDRLGHDGVGFYQSGQEYKSHGSKRVYPTLSYSLSLVKKSGFWVHGPCKVWRWAERVMIPVEQVGLKDRVLVSLGRLGTLSQSRYQS